MYAFVDIEHLLYHLPCALISNRATHETKIITHTDVNELHVVLFDGPNAPLLYIPNIQEETRGRRRIPLPEKEIRRLHLVSFQDEYLPKKHPHIQDTRMRFKKGHEAIIQIVYAKNETDTFYTQEIKQKKEKARTIFFDALQKLEEKLQLVGTYQNVSHTYPFIITLCKTTMNELKCWCTQNEYIEYIECLHKKIRTTYSDEQRAAFAIEKEIQRRRIQVETILQELIDAKNTERDVDELYMVYKAVLENTFLLFSRHGLHQEQEKYVCELQNVLRKAYFT